MIQLTHLGCRTEWAGADGARPRRIEHSSGIDVSAMYTVVAQ